SPIGGALGGACMIGLGLALAQRDRRVLVVTGDGELLMNVGALATIALLNPPNLSIVCVDNGHYGETGCQKSHTSLGPDLEQMAQGAGAPRSFAARATARSFCCCGSTPASRRSTSAYGTRPSAARNFGRRWQG